MNNAVEGTYKNFNEVIAHLGEDKEPSLNTWTKNHFTKVLVLTIASYFETEIIKIIVDYANKSCQNKKIPELVSNKINSREYSKLFDWSAGNVNKFLALFGKKFKDQAVEEVKELTSVQEGIKSFLELAEKRNEMVHANFGSFSLSDTPEEIYNKYKKAMEFIEYFEKKLNRKQENKDA
jgi:hypothetical protein